MSESNKIRYYRMRLGLSAIDLADAAKVSPSAISQWERGVYLPGDVYAGIRLARALNTTVADLFSPVKEKTP